MKIKLIDILQKYVAPSVLGGITVDSYRRQIHSHPQDILNIKESSSKEIKNATRIMGRNNG